MRVLCLARHNLIQYPGGDTIQITRTAEALRARGVQVDVCGDVRPRLSGYDVVHLFHLDRLWENQVYCERIRAQGRPAVLSTIYWPAAEFDRAGRAGFQGWLARLAGSDFYQSLRLVQRWGLHLLRAGPWGGRPTHPWRFRRAAQLVLESVRVLLPNSQAEREQIERHFGVRRPAVIVPNAADAALFGAAPVTPAAARQGVLCVGRIEPRKNQLALIEALGGGELPLTLVGSAGRFSRRYYRRCRQAAGPAVCFLGQQPPAALPALYRAARVHACVSWYETPGLASLEAALGGCALVVTPGGCTREYFGDEARYCQPDDVASIRAAVTAALEGEAPRSLSERVAREFTWEAAAGRTLAGYELALETLP